MVCTTQYLPLRRPFINYYVFFLFDHWYGKFFIDQTELNTDVSSASMVRKNIITLIKNWVSAPHIGAKKKFFPWLNEIWHEFKLATALADSCIFRIHTFFVMQDFPVILSCHLSCHYWYVSRKQWRATFQNWNCCGDYSYDWHLLDNMRQRLFNKIRLI